MAGLAGKRFEILGLAGQGGMGTVHRAQDGETGAIVALKLLAPHMRAHTARFVREAELLADLRHPSIVRHVAHGTTPDGDLWLAMEWLDGEVLGERLARGGLSVSDTLVVARGIAGALAHAHGRGVVHRDVKPDNVFLVGRDPADVRVLDFGIARVAGGVATRTGSVLGTPGYMAPEQARGDRIIDARADVFSLGCVMYECLTGVAPFAADQIMAVLARILLADPAPPSELVSLPARLDDLIVRMLAKDPARRPADGADVLAALMGIGAGDEALAPTATPRERGLGTSEHEWVTLVLARDAHGAGAAHADTVAEDATELATPASTLEQAVSVTGPFGARVDRLVDGTLVAQIHGAGPPRDRALAAARCALALRNAIDATVAVVTGRGVRGSRAPVGEVLDRAAFLLGLARVPGARVDETTAVLLETRFEVTGDGASLTLGKELVADEAPRMLLGQPVQCVGRERELAALMGLFDECVSEGVARIVLLTAAAGAGKSRLRLELLSRLRTQRAIVPWIARADIVGAGSPNAMLAQLVRHASGIVEGEPIAVQRQKLTARVARHVAQPERPRVAAFLGELVGAPFSDEELPVLRGARRAPIALGDQISAAWDDFLAAEVADGPRVIVLEDLHWGCVPTVRAIDRALRQLHASPLFVLATARPEVHEAFPNLFAERDVQEMRVVPLAPRACERLVRAALSDIDDASVASIVARSAGNAFVLEELVRARARGADTLPETVLAMAAARLESHDGDARRVLRAASVFGEVFWRAGVAALAGEAGLDGILDRLVAGEVIERRATSRFENEMCFRHALLRDAAYASLTADDLAVGHRLAAAWLARAGERDELVLAQHHLRGGEPALAARRLVGAAERALEGNDFAATVQHATRALELGGDSIDTVACLRLVADAEQWRGQFAASLEASTRATALVRSGSPTWYRLMMLQIIATQRLGRYDRLPALATEVCGAIPEPDASDIRVEVLARVAMRAAFFESPRRASSILDALGDLPSGTDLPNDEIRSAWIEAAHATRAHVTSDLAGYVEHIGRAADILFRMGNVRDGLSQLEDRGWWLIHLGAIEEADAVLTRVLKEAVRLGLKRVETNAEVARGFLLICDERPTEAMNQLRGLVAGAPGNGVDLSMATACLGWALIDDKRYAEALSVLDGAKDALGQGQSRTIRGLRIECLVALGRLEEARASLPELLTILEQPWSLHYDIEAWAGAGVAALALGEDATARRCATEALRLSALLGWRGERSARVRHHRRTYRLAEATGLLPV